MTKNPRIPYHHYMAAIEITYLKKIEDQHSAFSFKLNAVAAFDEKNIDMEALDMFRKSTMDRLENEFNIPHKDITNLVFLSIDYLGKMTEAQFAPNRNGRPVANTAPTKSVQ